MSLNTFNKEWENFYNQGLYLNKYPWDVVVSFIYRYYQREKPRNEIKILELGCGSGNNLWFAAREGFDVTGIDGSESAINFAKDRFEKEQLKGDFRVGDFSKLPFESDSYDFVIDRASITCCSFESSISIINEVSRVLRKKGKFLFNPYSEMHSSFVSGKMLEDGMVDEINDGTLIGVGKLYFYNKRDIFKLFQNKWNLISIEHSELKDELHSKSTVHADWRVIAEKK